MLKAKALLRDAQSLVSRNCENSLGVLGRNPWNITGRPEISGGATAAVAAGLCPAATGSEGGRFAARIPGNFCGIYTIKPTQGRVSGYTGLGGPPLPNTFSQAGPLTRTVQGSAILLQAMAGLDRRDQASIRRTPPDFVANRARDRRPAHWLDPRLRLRPRLARGRRRRLQGR